VTFKDRVITGFYSICRDRVGVEFNDPVDIILVMSEAVFTGNHLTDILKKYRSE